MKHYHAASAATLFSFNHQYLCVAKDAAAPVSPVAQARPGMFMPPSGMARTAQSGHNQNACVCDTFFLITLNIYDVLSQWHNQKLTYRAHTRARAVQRPFFLISIFNYLKKRLCHCASPYLARLCVCSTRMFLLVPIVTPAGRP